MKKKRSLNIITKQSKVEGHQNSQSTTIESIPQGNNKVTSLFECPIVMAHKRTKRTLRNNDWRGIKGMKDEDVKQWAPCLSVFVVSAMVSGISETNQLVMTDGWCCGYKTSHGWHGCECNNKY